MVVTWELVILLSSAALYTTAAPALSQKPLEENQPVEEVREGNVLRSKRSHAGYQYKAPCPHSAPQSGYQLHYTTPTYTSGHYPSPYGYVGYNTGYAVPQYRSDELEDPEMMLFSDMDSAWMPSAARHAYTEPAAPASHLDATGYGGLWQQYSPPVVPGPAISLFPNARVSGCSVPLLFSCSPSVVAGKMAQSHYADYGSTSEGGTTAAPAIPLKNGAYGNNDELKFAQHQQNAYKAVEQGKNLSPLTVNHETSTS